MSLNDVIIELERWDVVRVAPSTVRAFEGGPEGLEFVASDLTGPKAVTVSGSMIGGQTDRRHPDYLRVHFIAPGTEGHRLG
jgi:hypothetical protein